MDVNSQTRILIVDDDPYFLRVLKRILSEEKYQVTATSDSCQAIEILRANAFELVICDLRMPGCDGLTVLQSLDDEKIDVPVIILTAYGEVETYLEAMNAGAAEYLNKPVNSQDLLETVRSCLRRGSRRRVPAHPDPA